jgi:hypothetical protein
MVLITILPTAHFIHDNTQPMPSRVAAQAQTDAPTPLSQTPRPSPLPNNNGFREWNVEVWVVVSGAEAVCAKVCNPVADSPELRDQLFLEFETSVVALPIFMQCPCARRIHRSLVDQHRAPSKAIQGKPRA